MPLFYQHNINEDTELSVWHITEPEDFFSREVQLQYSINNPHKRLQHLAGRYLLKRLNPHFPLHLVKISESKKPVLPDDEWHFSISHCGDYAAAILSPNLLVGIDVEKITPKIELVKNKFLGDPELRMLPAQTPPFLTLCWSAKEAVYKWFGKGLLSFKNHIVLTDLHVLENKGTVICNFRMGPPRDLVIHFHLFENICLSWIAADQGNSGY
jgi:4'-phosphopantetheinyl transferase